VKVPVGVTDVVCLDAGVWIKALAAEELSAEAAHVLADSIVNGSLVAPAFCWAEVGSVLRKKVRARDLSAEEAAEAWRDFRAMPVTFIDTVQLRSRAWDLAERYGQPTLYDAAYLACTEAVAGSSRTFWTADDALLATLGGERPAYVRHLREVSPQVTSSG
jgi:predicted nucleic acid-binding protein